jgi:hypothetical protein
LLKALLQSGREHETNRAAQIGRRLAVEKGLCIGGEFVAVAVLRKKAKDGEIVCQDADSARRGLARIGELDRRLAPGRHLREQIKFDGRPESFGTLIGADRVEKQRGGWSLGRHGVSCLIRGLGPRTQPTAQRQLYKTGETKKPVDDAGCAERKCKIVKSLVGCSVLYI